MVDVRLGSRIGSRGIMDGQRDDLLIRNSSGRFLESRLFLRLAELPGEGGNS